jgi:hypothetical protein
MSNTPRQRSRGARSRRTSSDQTGDEARSVHLLYLKPSDSAGGMTKAHSKRASLLFGVSFVLYYCIVSKTTSRILSSFRTRIRDANNADLGTVTGGNAQSSKRSGSLILEGEESGQENECR